MWAGVANVVSSAEMPRAMASRFASNRDRHENLGDGEIGEEGLRRFLGHPDLQSLPVILEVPGMDGSGPDLENMARARRLHEAGVGARAA